MNILFYISPIIDQSVLSFHRWWLFNPEWMKLFKEALSKNYRDASFSVFCNSELLEIIKKEGLPLDDEVTYYSISYSAALNGFKYQGQNTQGEWHSSGEIDDKGRFLGKQILAEVSGCQPDVIFTFFPSPYLADIFPNAQLLHIEFSIFSRQPYPETYYADPWGWSQQSFVSRNADLINHANVPEKTLADLERYRNRIKAIFERESVIRDYFLNLRKDFKRIFIFAAGWDNYFPQLAFSPYESHFDFLYHVMSSVPSDTAVVVTQHPINPAYSLSKSSLDDLKKLYPNLIADDFFFNIVNPSQAALEFADGVITLNTTVGLQAAFMNQYFVSIGNFYPGIADCTDMASFKEMLNHPPKNRDRFFAWAMTHYVLPGALLSRLMPAYLETMRAIGHFEQAEAFRQWPAFACDVFDEFYFPHISKMENEFKVCFYDNWNIPSTLHRLIADRDRQITDLSSQIAARDEQISERDCRITDLSSQIAVRDEQITDLGSQIASRDEQITERDERIRIMEEDIKCVQASLDSIRQGISFRLGRCLTWLPRMVYFKWGQKGRETNE